MDVEILTTVARALGERFHRRRQRILPLAGAVIFHLLLLALIVSWKPPPMGRVESSMDVTLVSGLGKLAVVAPAAVAPILASTNPKPTPATVPAVTTQVETQLGSSLLPQPKPAPSPPKMLIPLLTSLIAGGPNLTATPLSISSPFTPVAAPAQTPGGKSCQILETLKAGLQGNDKVKAALLLIPAKSLSVAKAILLWDGQWIDPSTVGGASTLEPIKFAVLQTVLQAPPNCQSEMLQGVRFIILGDAHDTTVLAFGSSNWRWVDVIATLSPTAQN